MYANNRATKKLAKDAINQIDKKQFEASFNGLESVKIELFSRKHRTLEKLKLDSIWGVVVVVVVGTRVWVLRK